MSFGLISLVLGLCLVALSLFLAWRSERSLKRERDELLKPLDETRASK